VGTLFLLIGAIGFFELGRAGPQGMAAWIARLGAAVFAALGGIVVAWAAGSILWPARIRHAAAEVVPSLPTEPVIREGAVVHGRLTHELVEDGGGWQLRLRSTLWRHDKQFLLGFGIPLLVLCSGALSWSLHRQGLSWPVAILFGATASILSGGTAIVVIGMTTRASHRRLASLNIPRADGDLELDSPADLEAEGAELHAALKWLFLGDTKRQRLTIPRRLVAAVQLCPWKVAIGTASDQRVTWAVQGLLVLTPTEEGKYYRLPLLLTSDYVGAARLMQQLASTLQVPYLFCADATGWNVEAARAKNRPPLQVGGLQS
jgi:hypothetical protein